ncbi:hypothetical protein CHGG_05776 [Chaetomium globosum CBS 148.51]|uniref:tRNA-dihydrouridine(16/17) synthase [NAD(P)(+)] n=1 Tax=Chaetomium globosum (strain ATCC 6205 / CBS 148.51 / DSM 1962 / NBRC 6347 / NRRL 1970) TaxID=306901 RepID=Q2H6D9_CHAGB|nr:uncharacterized protein CHGG_05776 [Chaetomium globosum CBS 148.51]EAQ89157.1 hypothetical protein CHGG_05776 [Chaetomium globosum CBS 148.51]
MASDATPAAAVAVAAANVVKKPKLHGRAFYESLGSPKYIVAPMVDQSEFAWRMLSRSFLPESEQSGLLAYSPMFHARLFSESQKYRDQHFQPTKPDCDKLYLDGNPAIDRPFFVQFCANDPQALLNAAKIAAPYCDAVDLNLGCPQGIAKKGHYGSFLQEDQDLIHQLIKILHENLDIPVTAKIRILETKEATLKYAQNVLRPTASILTCLAATGADGIMSAEGNLSNPGFFAAPPPAGQEPRGYWRGKDGKGGWRVDEVFRRYLDIMHKGHPAAGPRRPQKTARRHHQGQRGVDRGPTCRHAAAPVHQLRHLVSRHHDVRAALARARLGEVAHHEALCRMVEKKVAEGLLEYEASGGASVEADMPTTTPEQEADPESSARAIRECKRPWWVVQPIIRPLPKEAMAKGAIQLSKKERKRVAAEMEGKEEKEAKKSKEGLGGKEAAVTGSLEKTTSYPSSELVSG